MERPQDREPSKTPAQDAYYAELDRLSDVRNIPYGDAIVKLQGTDLEKAMMAELGLNEVKHHKKAHVESKPGNVVQLPTPDVAPVAPRNPEHRSTSPTSPKGLTPAQSAQVLSLYVQTENEKPERRGPRKKLELGHAAFKISRLGNFDVIGWDGNPHAPLTTQEARDALEYIWENEEHTT